MCVAVHYSVAALSTLLLIPVTGCIALKDSVPPVPQAPLIAQWRPRYASSVCVRNPTREDFKDVTNRWELERKIQSGRQNAHRLAQILTQCRLFREITVSNFAPCTNALVIQALPNNPQYADADSPWLLLYGGVIPIYDRADEGVRFKFVKGGTNDFIFQWSTQSVLGFWAPFVAAVGPGWRLGSIIGWRHVADDSLYWNELRSALIEGMDRTDAVRE